MHDPKYLWDPDMPDDTRGTGLLGQTARNMGILVVGCLLIAGAFLLTPGFITDGFGAALLLPPLRRVIQRWAMKRLMARGTIDVTMHGAHRRRGGEDGVIDGEFVEIDDDDDSDARDKLPPAR